MHSRSGLSFVDVLIILAIVMLLAALAVPRFVKAPDYGNEEDDPAPDVVATNAAVQTPVTATTNATPAEAAPRE